MANPNPNGESIKCLKMRIDLSDDRFHKQSMRPKRAARLTSIAPSRLLCWACCWACGLGHPSASATYSTAPAPRESSGSTLMSHAGPYGDRSKIDKYAPTCNTSRSIQPRPQPLEQAPRQPRSTDRRPAAMASTGGPSQPAPETTVITIEEGLAASPSTSAQPPQPPQPSRQRLSNLALSLRSPGILLHVVRVRPTE